MNAEFQFENSAVDAETAMLGKDSEHAPEKDKAWYAQRAFALLIALLALIVVATSIYQLGGGILQCAVLGGISTLVVFSCTRLVQMRGRVTLGVMAIVLPSIVAVGCVAFMRLMPFWDRQFVADRMVAEQIIFRARAPDQAGEWLRDSEGYLLPSWCARQIGSNCMSPVRTIQADVENLGRIPLDRLGVDSLLSVELNARKRNTLGPGVADWLNKIGALPDPPSIVLSFDDIGEQDCEQLRRLNCDWSTVIHVENRDMNLSEIGTPVYPRIVATRFSVEQAEQLAELLRKTGFLILETTTLSPEIVQTFKGASPSAPQFAGAQIDAATAMAIVDLKLEQLQLSSIDVQNMSSLADQEPRGATSFLRLDQVTGDFENVCELTRQLGCKTLSFSRNLAGPLTKNRLNRLWDTCPELEEIDEYAGFWKEHRRADSKTVK